MPTTEVQQQSGPHSTGGSTSPHGSGAGRSTAITATTEAQSPMQLLQLAVQTDAAPERLEKLMDLQERWERREAEREFNNAVARFQSECPVVVKRREAAFGNRTAYTFASLDDIMRVIRPVLQTCGLSISFSTELTDGRIVCDCSVRCGVHTQTSRVTLPLPTDMRVNDTQKAGAAISYAKRYALCAALNIIVSDEDDDAARVASEPLTDEQVEALSQLAEQLTGNRRNGFNNWLQKQFGVEAVGDLPASAFGQVKSALLQAVKGSGK